MCDSGELQENGSYHRLAVAVVSQREAVVGRHTAHARPGSPPQEELESAVAGLLAGNAGEPSVCCFDQQSCVLPMRMVQYRSI
jgi:hypothetical protein